MKYIFFNPTSCAGNAIKKWKIFKTGFLDLEHATVIQHFYSFNWNSLAIKDGDFFISAGGDGTLHSMVNALIEHKGDDVLKKIKIGHIGLGSNNSFLRPYKDRKSYASIPYAMNEITESQDLLSISVDHKTIFCISNSSMGLLARANELFNTSPDIMFIKKLNTTLADIYTFFKTLFQWETLFLKHMDNKNTPILTVTNMHFMKRPFYTADLGFLDVIPDASGTFSWQLLGKRSKLTLLINFIKLLFLNQWELGRDQHLHKSKIHLTSHIQCPIEVDGEIYYGKDFLIQTHGKKIHLCK